MRGKEIKVGDKVTYMTPYKKQHGIVKAIHDDNFTFVVYNCGEDWENYFNYTAAKTANKNLVDGWL